MCTVSFYPPVCGQVMEIVATEIESHNTMTFNEHCFQEVGMRWSATMLSAKMWQNIVSKVLKRVSLGNIQHNSTTNRKHKCVHVFL